MTVGKLIKLLALLAIIVVSKSPGTVDASPEDDSHHHYNNEWVIHIRGTREAADQIAQELGYVVKNKLLGFDDHYLLQKKNVKSKSKRSSSHLTKRLTDHPIVIWAEQMITKRRVKRGNMYSRTIPLQHRRMFNDPLWTKQWYMHDTRILSDVPRIDLNVVNAWKMGYTGKGVVVTVVDDGLEWNHTDIFQNFDPYASWDANDNDADPMVTYDSFNLNAHGTRCAGEIAMVENNNKCGVGVAFQAKIGGIRMLDGPVTDAVEGVAIGFNVTHIDIFSASWGPTDDGKTVDGPGRLAKAAFRKGITQGRGGKGVIYIWASGNGGKNDDNCNCDGYTSSIYTLSIGSASQRGQFPWYGEMCASTMASTYSSGAYSDQKISTADLRNKCTMEHTGTSASAPLAAGIYALVLQANPNITWRDAQHLAVWTSSYEALRNNPGWHRNARGFLYSTRFGFGLMNASAIVNAAKTWINVPEQHICTVKCATSMPLKIRGSDTVKEITFKSDGCSNQNKVNYLEHTQVEATISYPNRGVLKMALTSPSGTETTMLTPRLSDTSKSGFEKWKFMSVHLWGENPAGLWKLHIADTDKNNKNRTGFVVGMKLILHGTEEMPKYLCNGSRQYGDEADVNNVLSRRSNDKHITEKFHDYGQRNYFDETASERWNTWKSLVKRLLPVVQENRKNDNVLLDTSERNVMETIEDVEKEIYP